jgi:hypothetical protein
MRKTARSLIKIAYRIHIKLIVQYTHDLRLKIYKLKVCIATEIRPRLTIDYRG